MYGPVLVVDFCGERSELDVGDQLTFGRKGDIVIDTDRRLHRILGRFRCVDRLWWIDNLGSSIPMKVIDLDKRSAVDIAPETSSPFVFSRAKLAFSVGENQFEIDLFITGATPGQPTERRFATVVFTDIVGSTRAVSIVGDDKWRRLLEEHDKLASSTCDQHRGKIVKSTGDGLLARFDTPNDGVEFARSLRDQLAEIGMVVRAGVHTGEIELRANQDITGIAVNIAARVEQAASDGAIYTSSTVRDMLLGGSVTFEDRGEHELKGIDGNWRLYEFIG